MRGGYYKVLGLPASATDAEIKAHYLRLMRRYHPDHNPSPLAHARAAEINEAFRFLSNPDLRLSHDAELAARRRAVVNARAINRSQQTGGRAIVVRRRRRPWLLRYGAWLTLTAVLAIAGVVGWQIEQKMLGGDEQPVAQASDELDGDAQRAVQALAAATAREAQDMPPVSSAVVVRSVGAYRRVASNGELTQARAYSQQCHAQAAKIDGWDATDFCVAFDLTAFAGVARMTTGFSTDAAYFIDRHDRAAHLYVTRVSSLEAIDRRLSQIQEQIATLHEVQTPNAGHGVIHSLSKHGWKLADAARSVLDAAPVQQGRVDQHSGDF